MIGAFLAVAVAAAPATTLDQFRSDISAAILDGARPLSVAQLRARISDMSPADRLGAIAFARRSGLFTAAPLPLEELLRDAPLLPAPPR